MDIVNSQSVKNDAKVNELLSASLPPLPKDEQKEDISQKVTSNYEYLKEVAILYIKCLKDGATSKEINERFDALKNLLNKNKDALTKEEKKIVNAINKEAVQAFLKEDITYEGKSVNFLSLLLKLYESKEYTKIQYSKAKDGVQTIDKFFSHIAKLLINFDNYLSKLESNNQEVETKSSYEDFDIKIFNTLQIIDNKIKNNDFVLSNKEIYSMHAIISMLDKEYNKYEDSTDLSVLNITSNILKEFNLIKDSEKKEEFQSAYNEMLKLREALESKSVLEDISNLMQSLPHINLKEETTTVSIDELENLKEKLKAFNSNVAKVCFNDIKNYDDSIERLRQIVKGSNLYSKKEFKKILTRELVYKIYFILKNEKTHNVNVITALTDLDYRSLKTQNFLLNILELEKQEIRDYLNSEYRKSISGMFGIIGKFPNMKKVNAFICNLKEYFIDTFKTDDKELFKTFFSSITSMQNQKGLPNIIKLKLFINELKEYAEKEEGLNIKDTKDFLSFFRSITGMQNGKGLPSEDIVDSIKKLKDKASELLKIDDANFLDFFRSITGMQNRKGLPSEDIINSIKNLKDDAKNLLNIEDANFLDFFRSITGMQHGKGLPNIKNLVSFISKLKTYAENEKEGLNIKDTKDFLSFFSSITGMQNGKGLPSEDIVDFIKKLKNDAKVSLNIVNNKDFLSLFSSITGMQMGKGLPSKNIIDSIKDFKDDTKKLLNIDDANFLDFFRSITGMQMGKGLPSQNIINSIKDIKDDAEVSLNIVNNEDFLSLFRSISSMQNGQGLPSENIIDFVGDFKKYAEDSLNIKTNEDFLSLFSSITGMQNGQGLASTINDYKKIIAILDILRDKFKDKDSFMSELQKITSLQLGASRTLKMLEAK